jgi:hypothetical protein
MWLNLAASRVSDDAKLYVETRKAVAGVMTAAQLAEARRLAREWRPKTWEELQAE